MYQKPNSSYLCVFPRLIPYSFQDVINSNIISSIISNIFSCIIYSTIIFPHSSQDISSIAPRIFPPQTLACHISPRISNVSQQWWQRLKMPTLLKCHTDQHKFVSQRNRNFKANNRPWGRNPDQVKALLSPPNITAKRTVQRGRYELSIGPTVKFQSS